MTTLIAATAHCLLVQPRSTVARLIFHGFQLPDLPTDATSD